jgi:hypothetical protein
MDETPPFMTVATSSVKFGVLPSGRLLTSAEGLSAYERFKPRHKGAPLARCLEFSNDPQRPLTPEGEIE